MPRSAPFANASLMVCFTRSGPMESAITSPPCFSFKRNASSKAKLSGSFISNPISDSRIQFPLMESGASFAGTCLTQTIIFTGYSLLERELQLLPCPPLENQRSVRAAKAKRIGQRVIHGRFARDVWHIVQVAFRVGVKLIDCRRQNLIAQRQHADAGFEATSAAKQMSGHGFCGAYRQFLVDRAFTEQAFHRCG